MFHAVDLLMLQARSELFGALLTGSPICSDCSRAAPDCSPPLLPNHRCSSGRFTGDVVNREPGRALQQPYAPMCVRSIAALMTTPLLSSSGGHLSQSRVHSQLPRRRRAPPPLLDQWLPSPRCSWCARLVHTEGAPYPFSTLRRRQSGVYVVSESFVAPLGAPWGLCSLAAVDHLPIIEPSLIPAARRVGHRVGRWSWDSRACLLPRTVSALLCRVARSR
ncbi:hypothetical protein C2E23DRAFT_416489 [Lenzites betulinus]|nr:hypothetical protein C2E23DRAFT_416489 [Lenzites betulinus]